MSDFYRMADDTATMTTVEVEPCYELDSMLVALRQRRLLLIAEREKAANPSFCAANEEIAVLDSLIHRVDQVRDSAFEDGIR